MTIFQAVILGIVQGITEFFPISSSGHLVIFQTLFGMKEPQLAFDIFLHFGTLVSIAIFFHKDIAGLFGKDKRLLLHLVIASIPTAIIGFLCKDIVEGFFGMPKVVGLGLVATGALLFFAARRSKKGAASRPMGPLNSVIIGIAQGVAVMPGISRSGATITAGILTGLKGEEAFRFSFLLAIPAVAGASLVKAHEMTTVVTSLDAFSFLAGGIVSALTGLAAMRVLLKLVRANKFHLFGIYCIIVGLMVIIFL